MKPNEFRIGNYVRTKSGNIIKIDCVRKDFVDVFFNDKSFQPYSYNLLKPIELTEDVFNSISYVSSVHLYDCLKRFVIMVEEGDWNFDLKDYPFLHQLQNLYFALKGQELEINL